MFGQDSFEGVGRSFWEEDGGCKGSKGSYLVSVLPTLAGNSLIGSPGCTRSPIVWYSKSS